MMLIPACAPVLHPKTLFHTQQILRVTHMLHRPPLELRPSMPAGLCQCAYQYIWLHMRRVMSIAQSHIWGANGDCQGYSVPPTTLNAPACTAQKTASFVLVTIHAWRCAYCICVQISIHKMAHHFQRWCVIATVTMNAMCLQASVAMEASHLPHQLFRQIYYAWASRLELCCLFKCPICGDNAEVLVGSVTSESIQGKCCSGVPITEVPEDPMTATRAHMRIPSQIFSNSQKTCRLCWYHCRQHRFLHYRL